MECCEQLVSMRRKRIAGIVVFLLFLILCPGPGQGLAQTEPPPKSISESKSGILDKALDRAGQASSDAAKGRAAANPELISLQRQGKLTVRALGAFGLLPDGFMSAARE